MYFLTTTTKVLESNKKIEAGRAAVINRDKLDWL